MAADKPEPAPRRIQLRRTAGWRLPEGAVVVSRPSRWGNPFIVSEHQTQEQAVENYRQALLDGRLQNSVDRVRRELGGKDLACWCPLVDTDGTPKACHADVLLDIANPARASGGPDRTGGTAS